MAKKAQPWAKAKGFLEGLGKETVTYTNGRTEVKLVLRPEIQQASIIKAYPIGARKDIKEVIEMFLRDHPEIKVVCNQVHREKEAIAMYEAGLRSGLDIKEDLAATMARLNKYGTVYMSLSLL